MKTTLVRFTVNHPDDVTPDDVSRIINSLLDVGYADARSSVEDSQFDNPDAKLAMKLDIAPDGIDAASIFASEPPPPADAGVRA